MGLTTQDYLILTAILGFLIALAKMVEGFGSALWGRIRNGSNPEVSGGGNPRPSPEASIEWMNTGKCAENRNVVKNEVNSMTKEVLEKVGEKTGKVHERLDEVKESVGEVEKVMIRLEGKVETAILQNQMLVQKEIGEWGKEHIKQYYHRPKSSSSRKPVGGQ